jgi:hypothetical protein
MAIFLIGNSSPKEVGAVLSTGIRYAIDIGLHREKRYAAAPTIENELTRRAFW